MTVVPVGTHIRYECPDGFYFHNDLIRRPYFDMTCTDTGEFDGVPDEWPNCVDRKFRVFSKDF